MKRLYLLRHAKSSWDDAAIPDHDRPLAPRGRKATALIEAHLRKEGIVPALVLCSPARRAQETLEGIATAFGPDVPVQTEQELYGASATDLVERLHSIEEAVPSVMLIGHNPAFQRLAVTLASGGAGIETLERKYPTGALATLALEGEWRELEDGSATLEAFVKPKDLQ